MGIDPLSRICERDLCAAAISFCLSCRLQSLPSYVSAVQDFAEIHGLGRLPRSHLFARVQRGLRNVFGLTDKTQPKMALGMSDLQALRTLLDFSRLDNTRDWLAYLIAFFALLRVREYVDGGLRMAEVVDKGWGLAITIPFSKTSIDPCTIPIVRRDDILCPLRAYRRYMELLPVYITANPVNPLFVSLPLPSAPVGVGFSAIVHVAANDLTFPPIPPRSVDRPALRRGFVYYGPPPSHAPLPRTVSCRPLQMSTFIADFKLRMSSLGRDPAHYAGHSFRRGGCTALFMAGVPETIVQAHGRWKSLAYRRYIQYDGKRAFLPTLVLRFATMSPTESPFSYTSRYHQAHRPLLPH